MSEPAEPEPAPRPAVAASIWALEHAQDFVSVAVGVVLIVLAATLAGQLLREARPGGGQRTGPGPGEEELP